MGAIRKWTGQKGAIEREKQYMNEQKAAAQDSERRQTAAMNESIRQAAASSRLAQEREAAQAEASAALSKPLAEADVNVGDTLGTAVDAARARRKKFSQDYSSGVNI